MYSIGVRSCVLNIDVQVFKRILSYKKNLFCTSNHVNPPIQNTSNFNLIQSNETYTTKLLKVAIIGIPNAGKSTLINNIMDRKVCPVSNKVHTTRKRTHAIITEDEIQIIFLDTPGVVTNSELKRFNLEKSFTKDCEKSLNEADIVGVIHDVSNSWTKERLDIKIIRLLEQYKQKQNFLVLNKIDCLKSKRKLLDITRSLTEGYINSIPFDKRTKQSDNVKGWRNFSEIFMISALTGDGVQEMKNYFLKVARPGKWLYPVEQWSDHTPEDIITRTVKATLLDFLPQEIPYKLVTKLEHYEVTENGKMITVVLVNCPSERIQKLVSGVGDGKLKQITEKAQKDLLHTFSQPVRLQIVVSTNK